MPEATAMPAGVDELFVKWLGLLDGGFLSTATYVAGDRPELIEALQLRINTYLADRADDVEDTLTIATESPANSSAPTLPDYTVLGTLGAGGMGVVYRVRDNLDREWALKLARHEQLTESGRQRFEDEARAMARLDGHPNVAPVRHLGSTTAGQPYFVMPVYPANLTSRLAEYQADPVKAVELMAAVAEGVAHLHSRGFIHRDLKPHNILIDANGRPAVSDFGLVKCLSDASSESPAAPVTTGSGETKPSGARRSKTVAGAAMGTRAYMAPEQAAGLTHLANPRWDVWALGVILHELLTGERPPSSLAPEGLLDMRAPGNPAPSEIKPGLDPKLEQIVQRCLARNEKDRFADARNLSEALRSTLSRAQGRRRRVVCLGLALLVVGIAIGLILAGPSANEGAPSPNPTTDPEAAFASMRESLLDRSELELVASTGLPISAFRMVGTPDHVQPYLDKGSNVMMIESAAPAHLLLIDNPGLVAYRFEAEVFQLTANPSSKVGILQGLHRVETLDGPSLCFATMTINHHTDGPKKPAEAGNYSVAQYRHLLPAPESDRGSIVSSLSLTTGTLDRTRHALGQWTALAVEVRPDRSTWHIDGIDKAVVSVPRPLPEALAKSFREIQVRPRPGTAVDVSPAGGLGLYVSNSAALFRNVRVSRVP
jgi:serine/threonine protein kinase